MLFDLTKSNWTGGIMPCGKKRKKWKINNHKRKKKRRANRHKKK